MAEKGSASKKRLKNTGLCYKSCQMHVRKVSDFLPVEASAHCTTMAATFDYCLLPVVLLVLLPFPNFHVSKMGTVLSCQSRNLCRLNKHLTPTAFRLLAGFYVVESVARCYGEN